MSMPFYVSPEAQMKDRADYARKGIARGRSVLVLGYDDGVAFVAENVSRSLHKVSEIYDRIAFAAVGRYNEFENLRIAGVRMADVRGYSYSRADVTSRNLANTYAQALGTIFSSVAEKPYEVELMLAEVGEAAGDEEIYRVTFDGSVADEHDVAVMGGSAERLTESLRAGWRPNMTLAEAVGLARRSLATDDGTDRGNDSLRLEVAVLERTRSQQRKFRRLDAAALEQLLDTGPEPATLTATLTATPTGPAGPTEPPEPTDPPATTDQAPSPAP